MVIYNLHANDLPVSRNFGVVIRGDIATIIVIFVYKYGQFLCQFSLMDNCKWRKREVKRKEELET